MIVRKKLPKSIRKFIRQEKTRIRREVLDFKKQEELIQELYQKISKIKKSPKNNLLEDKSHGNYFTVTKI